MASKTAKYLSPITIGALTIIGSAHAADLPYTGSFNNANDRLSCEFTIAAPQTVTLRSYSWGGGTMSDSTTIPAGGFDPKLYVFDSNGDLIDSQDDDSTDTVAIYDDEYYDVLLPLDTLAAGTYTVVLTAYSNSPINSEIGDNISAGWDNEGDFDGYATTYAFDLLNVDSGNCIVESSTPIQVPALPLLALWVLAGITGLFGAKRLRKAA